MSYSMSRTAIPWTIGGSLGFECNDGAAPRIARNNLCVDSGISERPCNHYAILTAYSILARSPVRAYVFGRH